MLYLAREVKNRDETVSCGHVEKLKQLWRQDKCPMTRSTILEVLDTLGIDDFEDDLIELHPDEAWSPVEQAMRSKLAVDFAVKGNVSFINHSDKQNLFLQCRYLNHSNFR